MNSYCAEEKKKEKKPNQQSLWHGVDQKYLHNIKPILSVHKQTCREWHQLHPIPVARIPLRQHVRLKNIQNISIAFASTTATYIYSTHGTPIHRHLRPELNVNEANEAFDARDAKKKGHRVFQLWQNVYKVDRFDFIRCATRKLRFTWNRMDSQYSNRVCIKSSDPIIRYDRTKTIRNWNQLKKWN